MMKNIFLLFAGFLFCFSTQAQEAAFGIKVGLATNKIEVEKNEQITVKNNGGIDTTYSYSAGGTKVGFHAGFMGRITFTKFYIQPELYVSSSNNEYSVEAVNNTGGQVILDDNRKSPSQQLVRLDIPVLFGYKLVGPLRVNAGPIATIVLSDDNGLVEALGSTAEGDSNNFTFGVQGGLGVDISKLTIDLRYETNLSEFGNDITVNGTTYNYDKRASQISLSLGILF